MSPLELIQDAEALAEMSTAEQLYAGAQVAVLGMVIVFTILLILLVTIKSIEKFAGNSAAAGRISEPKSPAKSGGKSEPEISGETKPEAPKEGLNPEVLAAITAAIQAFYAKRSQKFRVIRVEKKSRPVSAWTREVESEMDAVETRNENRR